MYNRAISFACASCMMVCNILITNIYLGLFVLCKQAAVDRDVWLNITSRRLSLPAADSSGTTRVPHNELGIRHILDQDVIWVRDLYAQMYVHFTSLIQPAASIDSKSNEHTCVKHICCYRPLLSMQIASLLCHGFQMHKLVLSALKPEYVCPCYPKSGPAI